ncbi:MAG TPA: GMC oxidoreductase [Myxococcaceae bacterium]|nr:GMC oxidoreductase [Myxococcaceae bacterium]
MDDSSKSSTRADYDFIIVGSGAGGAPLACNLARRKHRVLVLEAGDWADPEVARIPAFHAHASEEPSISWEFFVQHYADEARSESDRKWDPDRKGVFYPRTSTVGGCTVHNAMITITGPTDDWDEIAGITGDRSWNSDRMRTYFERIENCHYLRRPGAPSWNPLRNALDGLKRLLGISLNPGRHGFEGWLHTVVANPKLALPDRRLLAELLAAFWAAKTSQLEDWLLLLRSVLLDDLDAQLDPNHWQRLQARPEGLALIPIAVRDGVRSGPRDLLRQTMKDFPNLTVQTETLVTEVILEAAEGGGPTAKGVRFLRGKHLYSAHPQRATGSGVKGEALCRKEVILCGGAFNTPQLLMLSGIGPRSELERHGLPVRVDRPGVGTNLQDRYEVGVVSKMKHDFPLLKGLTFGPPAAGRKPDTALDEWEKKKTGLYATNGAVLGILKKSRPELLSPDLCIFGLPGFFKGYFKGYSKKIAIEHNLFTWAILKAHTKNRGGRVTLRSANPLDTPVINFRYFDEGTDIEEDDLSALVEGVKFVRGFSRHLSSATEEIEPGTAYADDETLRSFVRNEAWGHHASCTCPIGADGDPMAVLDSSFRVRGVRQLRVVDASVFPRIPGIFIVSNIYMVAEKASDVIAEAWS